MEVVRNLRYADDTTIIVGTKLIEIMERVRKTSKETSLYRNVLNTKVNTTGYIEDVTVDGKMVDVVTIFIFPGALIIRDGLCDKEIRRGIAMGKASYSSSRSHLVVCVAAADTILPQQVLSWTTSIVVPMALMSRLTQSIHICFMHLSRAFLHLSVMLSIFSLSLIIIIIIIIVLYYRLAEHIDRYMAVVQYIVITLLTQVQILSSQ